MNRHHHPLAASTTARGSLSTILFAGCLILALVACSDPGGAEPRDGAASTLAGSVSFALPDEDVFPNGVAFDPDSGDLFTASTEDGTVYRASIDDTSREATVFLEPGTDGRGPVYGMRVDRRGRLFLAGGERGVAFVYDIASGQQLDELEGSGTIGDVAVTADAAFFTSTEPILYRTALTTDDVGELEPWLDLRQSPLRYEQGANLDGITASGDGRYLIAFQRTTEQLWRIDTRTGQLIEIDLAGEELAGANGLLLDGTRLYAANTEADEIMTAELDDDLTGGEVGDTLTDSSLNNPTSLAHDGNRLLVANHQVFGEPVDLPFRIASLKIPA